MIAVRVLWRLELGIVAAVLFVLLAAPPYRPIASDRQAPMSSFEELMRARGSGHVIACPLEEPPNAERLRRILDERAVQKRLTVCDIPDVTTIIVRGHLSSPEGHFAFTMPGVRHVYSAITDEHGTFELRIPRDDFDEDLCRVPEGHSFADSEMSLSYHYDVE